MWKRDERGRDRLTMAGAVECGREMREVKIDRQRWREQLVCRREMREVDLD